jgi:DNA-3-methyladenine glycosylase I
MNLIQRCSWPKSNLSVEYHDREWGVPVHDDHLLFEALVLGGAQAGLNWEIVLKKRTHYRAAFHHFDPLRVSRFRRAAIERMLNNPGLIRNRLKLESAVSNAKAFLMIQEEFGSFDTYIWRFVGGTPKVNHWKSLKEIPARSPESDALSENLRQRGFKFVGSTIIYAVMQAVGMVNDHTTNCFRWSEVQYPS